MAEYLTFLSHLAAAQHRAAVSGETPVLADARALSQARAGGMPLLPRQVSGLDGQWRKVLADILREMAALSLPPEARQVVERLSSEEPALLDSRAAGFLLFQKTGSDLAADLFVASALQVVWAKAAEALDPSLPQTLDPPGLCPVCGSPPVAGIVMAAEPLEGVRYLGCGLCGCHWHYPRATCSSCGSDKDIGYLSLEGMVGHARGETCGECRTYLKLFDEEKSTGAEPFADDLATLGLDLRLAEDGWHRALANPFLMAEPG